EAAPSGPVTGGFVNLDELPFPNYDDYFDQLSRSTGRFDVELPFESARGCWWGAKHHCTFCGLNGADMTFRRKSPARLLEEVRSLYSRYGDRIRGMFDVSNILDMKYFDDFIPGLSRLAASDDFYIFVETKSNLSRSQVAALADARVNRIQPGIESLSTPILRLMRKGCTSLQNIELLKWCQLSGVRPEWNLLYGFPGEDRDEYDRQIELMPLLHHLPPPANVGPVRVDRFSPYFETPEDFGITALCPQAPYRHVYRVPPDELDNIAYYFDFECPTLRTDGYATALEAGVRRWEEAFGHVELLGYRLDDSLMIHDTRACAVQEWTPLEGPQAHAIELLESSLSENRLFGLLATKGLSPASTADVLDELIDRKFVLREGTRSVGIILITDAECPVSPDRMRGVRSASLAVV
ncbi:MAG: RiPP maturation radical SAM C-methyltransferase, partial [Rhodothermia bacterium]|nr:RiPP maturation radical SAM C-methyltransferase [Rhodothermia bacterium]